ncbi:MAG: GNAT family N-acetyltransferase [Oscillospiraceae bacterium]|nr:GNAT family N-acetyltransferase [Oscillospiraceae bacterium]
MEFRLAQEKDLPQIEKTYRELIVQMEKDGIDIWDEVYPCAFFKEDVGAGALWILTEGEQVAAAFALLETNSGADAVEWEDPSAKAMYLDRLGVGVAFARQGLGGRMLRQAAALAKEKGASWLRLFVVDRNEPAISLYRKAGFQQAKGVYEERIDDELTLLEYGFEQKL